jgi:M6 family metalloprotease-like protein
MQTTKRFWLAALFVLLVFAKVHGQTTNIRGLVVLVNFKDYQLKGTEAQFNDMFNQASGFSSWGNTTSVREYYRIQSANKVDFTNQIISVTLPENSTHYIGDNTQADLVQSVVAAINTKYPNGFTNLSLHPTSHWIWNFSMVCQTNGGGGVAWQTPETPALYIKNNGVNNLVRHVSLSRWSQDYQYDVNVVCHEYGHSVFNWPDYYHTAISNLGFFCLMGSGGSKAAPMPISPFFRQKAGWVSNIVNLSANTTATYTLTANSYTTLHKYANPSNPKEYLLFHAVKHDRYYQPLMENNAYPVPEGLAIYYVDEESGFGVEGLGSHHPIVKLVQADNKDQMHDENMAHIHLRGDVHDLYGNGNNSFPNGHPWKWRDGGEFGISITNITRSGNNVSFTVQGSPSTVVATSDENGSIQPSGVVRVDPQVLNQLFTFVPKPGYEINTVRVNGHPIRVSGNHHRMMDLIAGTQTIEVTYKRSTPIPPLPAPWQHIDIGSHTTSGHTGYADGKFYMEGYGNDIWHTNDNFSFVYQPLNGNGSIEGRLHESNKANPWAKSGLMVRGSLQPNAAHGMLIFTPSHNIRIQYRNSNGAVSHDGPMQLADLHKYQLYKWFRVTRQGNTVSFYISRDRINWAQLGQQTITLPQQVFVGMVVSGANGNYPNRSTFDNLTVSETNNLPCVSGTKINGNGQIGTTGSYGNWGNTRDKAFDGNVDTYFEAPGANQVWTGISLSTPHKVTGVRYHPRKGVTRRMMGGVFQGSNSPTFSSGVVNLATITMDPGNGWNCLPVSNQGTFLYLRYIGPDGSYGMVAEIEFYGEQGPACTLSGTPIAGTILGTAGSWNNTTNTRDKVFDGNVTTFFDAPVSQAWIGVSPTVPHRLTGVRYYPRADNNHRMTGGKFQGSNTADFSSGVTDLATIVSEPSTGWNCITISNTNAFRYLRYLGPVGGHGNVSEVEFYGTPIPDCSIVGTLLSGTSIGSTGSHNNSGNTRDKAFDGNVNTFFDGSSDLVWTGQELNNYYTIRNIRFYPRAGNTYRMIGGKFQGSDSPDFSFGVVDLATITSEPLAGWNCLPVNNKAVFKYVRYIGPVNGFGNVAEIQFYGTLLTDVAPVLVITSPASNSAFTPQSNVTIEAFAADPYTSISKVEFYRTINYGNVVSTGLLGSDFTEPYSITFSNNMNGASGYTITAVAYNSYGSTASQSIPLGIASGVSGPSCAAPNSVVNYSLSSSAQNGTVFIGWYYTGTHQQMNGGQLVTGPDFTAGNVCAVAVFNMGQVQIHHCKWVNVCSGAREGILDATDLDEEANTITFQNPFSTTSLISFGDPTEEVTIQVLNSTGVLLEETKVTGSFEFGENVVPGLYLLRLNFQDRSEVLKLIKQ